MNFSEFWKKNKTNLIGGLMTAYGAVMAYLMARGVIDTVFTAMLTTVITSILGGLGLMVAKDSSDIPTTKEIKKADVEQAKIDMKKES